MKYRIKDLHDAAVRNLKSHGGYRRYDVLSDRNDLIIANLFNRTMAGAIKGFYLHSESVFHAYTRSTKEAGRIQYSYGFYRDGELIPCGDVQMETAKDLIREGYSSGIYEEIA